MLTSSINGAPFCHLYMFLTLVALLFTPIYEFGTHICVWSGPITVGVYKLVQDVP